MNKRAATLCPFTGGMCLDPAGEAQPGYGPPDRVTGSQTLEALLEANEQAPSHQRKSTLGDHLILCY